MKNKIFTLITMMSVILSTAVFAMEEKEDQVGSRKIVVQTSPTMVNPDCDDLNCPACKPFRGSAISPAMESSVCGPDCTASTLKPTISIPVKDPTISPADCGDLHCPACKPFRVSTISNLAAKQ